jgi:hypothetical protein
MSELISREEAEKFLALIDPSRAQWKFRAEHEDGRAEELIATFDDAFSKLCELNRNKFEIFVSADVAYRKIDLPAGSLLPDEDRFYFLAALCEESIDNPDPLGSSDWDGEQRPHIAVTVGRECIQCVWLVTGLSETKSTCLRATFGNLFIASDALSEGFAYLPGFATFMGSSYGAPFLAQITQVRDGAPFNGIEPWKDYLTYWCYAGDALAKHRAMHKPHAAGDACGADDDRVLAAMRAAAAAGDRVPARAGTHATAWHVLRAFPELGAALANRKGRDRVHTALRQLQQAGKVRRVEGRTAGRRECEFFEVVPG